jgi:hypothetical protein
MIFQTESQAPSQSTSLHVACLPIQRQYSSHRNVDRACVHPILARDHPTYERKPIAPGQFPAVTINPNHHMFGTLVTMPLATGTRSPSKHVLFALQPPAAWRPRPTAPTTFTNLKSKLTTLAVCPRRIPSLRPSSLPCLHRQQTHLHQTFALSARYIANHSVAPKPPRPGQCLSTMRTALVLQPPPRLKREPVARVGSSNV